MPVHANEPKKPSPGRMRYHERDCEISVADYHRYFKAKGHKFVSLAEMDANQIRGIVGVYFLIRDSELVYIGQSKNVYRRVASHSIKHDKFWYVECKAQDLDEIESAYIHIYKPPLNGSLVDEKVAPLNHRKFLDRVKMTLGNVAKYA